MNKCSSLTAGRQNICSGWIGPWPATLYVDKYKIGIDFPLHYVYNIDVINERGDRKMKAIITKASDSSFLKPFNSNEIELITKLIATYGSIIIEKNDFWKDESIDVIKRCFNINNDKLAKYISESDYYITIYDDYIE